jgi:hypothetical protein
MSRGTRVVSVEVREEIGGGDVPSGLPAVVADIVALPLDQVFDASVPHAAIQDFFDFEVFVTIDQLRGGWGARLSSWNGVRDVECKFRDREDSVEATERSWEG